MMTEDSLDAVIDCDPDNDREKFVLISLRLRSD